MPVVVETPQYIFGQSNVKQGGTVLCYIGLQGLLRHDHYTDLF